MAKKLAFEQSIAEQGTIDGFEWTGFSGAILMDCACRELFASTRLAAYQHCRVAVRDLCNTLEDDP